MHKLFGRGDLYCWNCGGRQHVGKKRCPHCGAYYNNSSKPVIKRAKAHPGLGPLHYTVVSYIVKYILFSILFAFGWCCIMYFFMDVTFVDERKYVYVILWGFWLIWLFFWSLGKVKDVFKTRAKNAMPGLSVTCAMCGIQLPRNHRFCPDCGTVIFAHHSDSDVITEEEAKNEKLSHKAARKARGAVSGAVGSIAKDAVEQITKSVFGALAAVTVISATMMLTACDPHWANAQRHIEWALNPDDGSWLTTDQFIDKFSSDKATRSDKIWGRDCIIELPLTNADIRPQEGVNYVGMGSGTTMLFQFSENADTLCHTIGKVDINWREDRWGFDVSEDEIRLNPNRFGSKTYFVESRGKSVYTLYEYEERTDTLGNPIADSLGNVQADIRRLGMLLFVYPGADSILVHRGSKETQRTFKIN